MANSGDRHASSFVRLAPDFSMQLLSSRESTWLFALADALTQISINAAKGTTKHFMSDIV